MKRSSPSGKGRALTALLLIVSGSGTPPATADDRDALDTPETPLQEIEEHSREQARLAIEAAALEAASAVAANTRLDLDTRLTGRKSEPAG